MEIFNDTYMNAEFALNTFMRDCYNIHQLAYKERCHFVSNSYSCLRQMLFINYPVLVYCKQKVKTAAEEKLMHFFLLILCAYMLVMTAIVAENYFLPMINIIAKKLKMSDHLAGVTIIAMANAMPDVFQNISRQNPRFSAYTSTMAASIFGVLVVGGTVCFLSPVKLSPYQFVMDILFFVLATLILDTAIKHDGYICKIEALKLAVIYIIYLSIVLVDNYFIGYSIKMTKYELGKIARLPPSENNYKRYYNLSSKLNDLLHTTNANRLRNEPSSNVGSRTTSSVWARAGAARPTLLRTPPPTTRTVVNDEYTRTVAYSPENPKNKNLITEFFMDIFPIGQIEWEFATFFEKIYILLKSPIELVCFVCIPRVDVKLHKHGWTKLLNCMQIVITPSIVLTAVMAIVNYERVDYFIRLDFIYIIYCLPILIPLAIFVFCISRTDLPPPHHHWFGILSISGSVCFIFICAVEIDQILYTIGLMWNLSTDTMAISVCAISAGISDLITNISLTMNGYPEMAYTASLIAPMFATLLSASIVYSWKSDNAPLGQYKVPQGNYCENSFIFLLLTLCSTLLWALILNFFARRSIGLYGFSLYALFMLYAFLSQKSIISSYQPQEWISVQ